jgi:hypothetical protein
MSQAFRLICKEQHIIINSLQIKEFLLLNSILAFVCKLAQAFGLICKEQHITINSLQIKELLMLRPLMGVLCVMGWALKKIWSGPPISSTWPQTSNCQMPKIRSLFSCGTATAFRKT